MSSAPIAPKTTPEQIVQPELDRIKSEREILRERGDKYVIVVLDPQHGNIVYAPKNWIDYIFTLIGEMIVHGRDKVFSGNEVQTPLGIVMNQHMATACNKLYEFAKQNVATGGSELHEAIDKQRQKLDQENSQLWHVGEANVPHQRALAALKKLEALLNDNQRKLEHFQSIETQLKHLDADDSGDTSLEILKQLESKRNLIDPEQFSDSLTRVKARVEHNIQLGSNLNNYSNLRFLRANLMASIPILRRLGVSTESFEKQEKDLTEKLLVLQATRFPQMEQLLKEIDNDTTGKGCVALLEELSKNRMQLAPDHFEEYHIRVEARLTTLLEGTFEEQSKVISNASQVSEADLLSLHERTIQLKRAASRNLDLLGRNKPAISGLIERIGNAAIQLERILYVRMEGRLKTAHTNISREIRQLEEQDTKERAALKEKERSISEKLASLESTLKIAKPSEDFAARLKAIDEYVKGLNSQREAFEESVIKFINQTKDEIDQEQAVIVDETEKWLEGFVHVFEVTLQRFGTYRGLNQQINKVGAALIRELELLKVRDNSKLTWTNNVISNRLLNSLRIYIKVLPQEQREAIEKLLVKTIDSNSNATLDQLQADLQKKIYCS